TGSGQVDHETDAAYPHGIGIGNRANVADRFDEMVLACVLLVFGLQPHLGFVSATGKRHGDQHTAESYPEALVHSSFLALVGATTPRRGRPGLGRIDRSIDTVEGRER